MKIHFNSEVLSLLMPDCQSQNKPPHILAKEIILSYYNSKKEHITNETKETGATL